MPEISASRYRTDCSWSEVPHLTEKDKKELLASFLPHQRDARTKGIPSLGSGAIYPIPVEQVIVDPFPIPEFWPRAFALDVGWNRTAAIWGARDAMTDTIFLYSEYYAAHREPSVHAEAIKARGDWINGVCDPAGVDQSDGTHLMAAYQGLGLKLRAANKDIDAGLLECLQRLSDGRLKAFSTLRNWQAEYRVYRRDEKGNIVKLNDHAMDCMRYLIRGFGVATTKPMADILAAQRGGPATPAGY